MMPGMGPPNRSNKIGFSTYALWGVCFIVFGVCWKMEQMDEEKRGPVKSLPDDVQRKLPSGALLMSKTLPNATAEAIAQSVN